MKGELNFEPLEKIRGRKNGSFPGGKTKEEKAFYLKYGIWGTARQVAEWVRWKKGERIWGAIDTTRN
jgi:hypothetical protein